MATEPHTKLAREWATLNGKLEELNLYLSQAPAHERNQVEHEIAALQDEILDTSAPHLTGVLRKLEIMFEGQLHGLDQASEERRLILEDLESLIQAQHELLGS